MARLAWMLVTCSITAWAGPTIWNGSFNPYRTAEDFDKCKFIVWSALSLIKLPYNKGLGQTQWGRING